MIDAELIFEENAALSAAVTSGSLDLGQAKPDMGMLDQDFVVQVLPDEAVGGTGTVTFKLQDSADNSSFADVLACGPIVGNDLTDDFAFRLPLTHRRYVRIVTVVSGSVTGNAMIALTNTYTKKSWNFRDTVEFNEPDPNANVRDSMTKGEADATYRKKTDKINLTTDVSGVLPTTNGGTGSAG